MNAWRMAFRDGKNGPEMWPRCRELRVAAIEYRPVDDIDFTPFQSETKLPPEVREAWLQLAAAQKASFRRFRWEMKENDVIYVKQGPLIIGKGIVGPYQFDADNRIQGMDGEYWQHQRPVTWMPDFPQVRVQLGRSQQFTVEQLTAPDVQKIEEAVARGMPSRYLPPEEADGDEGVMYVPENNDRRQIVERQIRERRGQQGFRDALRDRYGSLCLVTGCTVLEVLEAAHISPYRGEEDNHPENGLLLRSDIHTLFDLDLLGIEPAGLHIEMHPGIVDEYGHLAGRVLGCTRDRRPSREALRLRYEQFRKRVDPPV